MTENENTDESKSLSSVIVTLASDFDPFFLFLIRGQLTFQCHFSL